MEQAEKANETEDHRRCEDEASSPVTPLSLAERSFNTQPTFLFQDFLITQASTHS